MSPAMATSSKFVRFLTSAAVAGATLMIAMIGQAPAAIASDDLIVSYDQSQLVRLPRPISSIVIGNPSIADVAVQKGNLLVVTGKTFGITNIIAIDEKGQVIQDQRVIVQRDERRIVNLHKGSQRQSFSCSPNCSPTITIGDGNEYFEQISKHSQEKTSFSIGTAGQPQN